MLWINLVTLGAFGLGFVLGWRTIQKGRMPYRLEGSLVEWDESPAPATHYDRLAAALISMHGIGTLVLCALLVLAVNRAGAGPFSMAYRSPLNTWLAGIVGFEDKQISNMSLFIAALGAGIAAMTAGTIVSFPFSRKFIQPVHVHIHAQGVIYGQRSAQWPEIGFYEIDRERGLFTLFTHKHPNTPTFALKPDEGLFGQVERTLAEMLPGKEGAGNAPSAKRRERRALLFVLVMLAGLAVGWWLSRYVAEWAWSLQAVAIVGYSALGMLIPKI